MGIKLYLFLSWTHSISVSIFMLQILWASYLLYYHPTTLRHLLFRRTFAFLVITIFSSGIVIAAFSPLTLAAPLTLIKIIGMLVAIGLALAAFNVGRTQQSKVLFLSSAIFITITLILVSTTHIFGI
ncbi:MAG: hypothetical protein KAH22_01070 [Thiotrichaceae bacterium]|nr:hypothetical protein [Thiotrichaceae bacterium]